MSLYAGIDAGTQSLKVVVYDPATRQVIASTSEALALDSRDDGSREQDPGAWVEAMRTCFGRMDVAVRRRIVALAGEIQARTAQVLARPQPGHRLSLQHVNLHNVLMGEDMRSVPFLPDELRRLLGVAIHVDAGSIEIVRGEAPAPSHSPARVPADIRA